MIHFGLFLFSCIVICGVGFLVLAMVISFLQGMRGKTLECDRDDSGRVYHYWR